MLAHSIQPDIIFFLSLHPHWIYRCEIYFEFPLFAADSLFFSFCAPPRRQMKLNSGCCCSENFFVVFVAFVCILNWLNAWQHFSYYLALHKSSIFAFNLVDCCGNWKENLEHAETFYSARKTRIIVRRKKCFHRQKSDEFAGSFLHHHVHQSHFVSFASRGSLFQQTFSDDAMSA